MESSRVLTRRSASEVSHHRLYLSNSFRAWSRSSSNWVLGKFLVETIGNHANFHTNLWIRAHPFYFLTKGRKDVDVISLICKTNWNHVRRFSSEQPSRPIVLRVKTARQAS